MRPVTSTYDPLHPSITTDPDGYLSPGKTEDRESLASLQSTMWPYSLGERHMGTGKVNHRNPPAYLFSNRTSTTTRYPTDAPQYTAEALATADKSGRKHPWYGTSLANQRYQFHMMLSNVALKQEDQDHDPASKSKWDELQECTEGSKTDTLVPGASVSNSLRWAPLPAGPLTDLNVLVDKRSASPNRASSHDSLSRTKVPLTCTGFVLTSRAAKEAERQARERRRIFEHAKKQGVEDFASWLESLEGNKSSKDSVKIDYSRNRWSASDKHESISVSADGLTIAPNYRSMKDSNGLVRAEMGYYSGRHYWEITLQRFAVAGQGWHCIGVASNVLDRDAYPDEIVMSSSQDAACLCLENCQKLRGSGRPQEYGKRAVKQGDVVGVLLDLDLGELSFFVNGSDMGVAFYGMRGTLFPAVEMGMMVGQQHEYRANFDARAPPRRKMEAPPMSDDEAFRHIKAILPLTSKKYAQEGFGAILSVPSTMPHEAPGGIHYNVSIYPQMGEYLLHGVTGNARVYEVTPLARTKSPAEEFFSR